MTRLMAEALARVKPADANEAALRELVEADAGSPIQPRLEAALREKFVPTDIKPEADEVADVEA